MKAKQVVGIFRIGSEFKSDFMQLKLRFTLCDIDIPVIR